MEVKGIYLEKTNEGFIGHIDIEVLESFLRSLSQRSLAKKFSFKVFEFANPRPNHSHGLKLTREAISMLQVSRAV